MTFEYLRHLKSTNKTLKILNSDNFPLTLSFFHFAFIKEANIALPHSQILLYLDDFLFDINQSYDNLFSKSAKEYLDDFASDTNGYLRKYHGADDEPLYELTPYVNKALEFVESLDKKEFVGSRSKFNIIFELLEDLEFETNLDDTQRIKKLEAQKRDIDSRIEAIKAKEDLRFDSARIKEHFMQLDEMVRKLKYDFSEMEYNFRDLNTLAMEQIALKDDAKADVLSSIFDVEDSIRESDQGKSFFAFWQLLTDATQSEKLTKLLENLYEIETIKEFDKDQKLKDVKYTLLKSGEKIYSVSVRLIEQLRRFLDDRIWIENRRILELCKQVEKSAIDIKQDIPTKRGFFEIKGDKVKIDSIFEKSLYTLKEPQEFKKVLEPQEIEIDLNDFYKQFFIDEEQLKRNIDEILLYKSQCTIADIVKKFEIKKGVGELIGYISIAKNMDNSMVDESQKQKINIVDFDGNQKIVSLPKIIFLKGSV